MTQQNIQADRQRLEALVLDNDGLQQLEQGLGQFNIFEAIGAIRHELRHSDFLAFLLDPAGNHSLGDEFLKRFLQRAVAPAGTSLLPVSPIDFDVWSLEDVIVRREWHFIDILIEDPVHKFVVAIENKIDSGEHSNQLPRAWDELETYPPAWQKLGFLLSPDVRVPSDDRFISVNYELVCRLVEDLVARRTSTLGGDVRTMMTHYAQALRRHIVADSETADLCRRIYQKHKQALDLIYEHRPDRQAAIRDLLEPLITATPDLKIDYSIKTYIRFYPTDWDTAHLRGGAGWTPSGRILLFEFTNSPTGLRLGLTIGPGPDAVKARRQAILNAALRHGPPLRPARQQLMAQWNTIYRRDFLSQKTLEEAEGLDELEPLIRENWNRFVQDDLPKIRDVIAPLGSGTALGE